jgi:hypothetical protein
MRFYFRTGRCSGVTVGPAGMLIVGLFYGVAIIVAP